MKHPPDKRNGRPPQAPVAFTAPAKAPQPKNTALRGQRQPVIVSAVAYGPSGRRTRTLMIAACTLCAGVHVHFGRAGVRRSGSGRGFYRLVASVDLPAVAA